MDKSSKTSKSVGKRECFDFNNAIQEAPYNLYATLCTSEIVDAPWNQPAELQYREPYPAVNWSHVVHKKRSLALPHLSCTLNVESIEIRIQGPRKGNEGFGKIVYRFLSG